MSFVLLITQTHTFSRNYSHEKKRNEQTSSSVYKGTPIKNRGKKKKNVLKDVERKISEEKKYRGRRDFAEERK